ncbi:flagellar biosynthesis anti-sigma factor FlgM [Chitinimonas sp. BJB300]|uniref:flagellar biosynthesis anti-sigma factor FlgM n=1 Tax=Chitinimonas sp. BJB300 TaxID=1559339 RepID=UPI000C0FC427|nr:flagellar biosynthesis anti-sigma factor FlgM [Chitinimonas sp. BJB300]PHV13008.1 flagellar biosynthesis anti-sigma factor FlgM [Chitinimonas sp. BJB300]TSJ88935.1 flagellar biosynthesis anti-sigma factor FlgM [Chitinimonas sp. BJB300]
MKVDNSGRPLSATLARAEARAANKQTAEGSNGGDVRSDNVDITAFSARLASLEVNLGKQPVIDEAKVNEIRQAIAEGRFTINPDAIADKVMASVKELLGKS